MTYRNVCCTALFFFITSAHANLYKCVTDGVIGYQSMPCGTGIEKNLSTRPQQTESNGAFGVNSTTKNNNNPPVQISDEKKRDVCLKYPEQSEDWKMCRYRSLCRIQNRQGPSSEIEKCANQHYDRSVKDAQYNKSNYSNTIKTLDDRVKTLNSCVKNGGCSILTYQANLKCMPIGYVEKSLGPSIHEQKIGGNEIFYYSVPTDSKKYVKLQLIMSHCTELPMPGGSTNRVSEVNIY